MTNDQHAEAIVDAIASRARMMAGDPTLPMLEDAIEALGWVRDSSLDPAFDLTVAAAIRDRCVLAAAVAVLVAARASQAEEFLYRRERPRDDGD